MGQRAAHLLPSTRNISPKIQENMTTDLEEPDSLMFSERCVSKVL